MGQRLNIEIWNNGKALANCYYHWSAYSGEAWKLTNTILENIEECNTDKEAVDIFRKTGATLSTEENADRNNGLISSTPKEINSTRYWAEGSVYIYVDEKRIHFDVFHSEDVWEWRKENERTLEEQTKLEKNITTINLNDIKFKDINKLRDFILDHQDQEFMNVFIRRRVLSLVE